MEITSLKVGYIVALSLKPGTATLRSFVGQIEAMDELGLRVTLVDWLVGKFDSYDLFVPWSSITSALVATPEHDIDSFGDHAGKWQEQMAKLDQEPVPTEIG